MRLFFILLLLFIYNICSASKNADLELFSSLKTTEERINYMQGKNGVLINNETFQALLPAINEKDDPKAAFFWYFQANQSAQFYNQSPEKCYANIDRMLFMAEKYGLKPEMVVVKYQEGLSKYANKTISEPELYYIFLNCFEQIKSIGIASFKVYSPEWMLNQIGRNFYEMGDEEKALVCLLEVEKICNKASTFYTLTLNLIESIYDNKQDYNNAILYASKIYNYHKNYKPQNDYDNWIPNYWQCLTSLHIANYLIKLKNPSKANFYLNRGTKLLKHYSNLNIDYKVIAEYEALVVMAEVNLALNNISVAGPILSRADTLKNHIGLGMQSYYFKPLALYKNYVAYYAAKKDYAKAFKYLQLANNLHDSLIKRNDKRKLWQMEMQAKAEKFQSEIKLIEEENKLQQIIRNVAILIMLIILVLIYIIYKRLKKDHTTISSQKISLEKSLEEKETLLKEVHHRVKNNLQIVSGLLGKQARKTDDALTKQLLKEGQDRVFSIALVHQNLYQSENLSHIKIKTNIQMLINNICSSQYQKDKKIDVELNADETVVNIDTAHAICLILNELITNCFKHAFKGMNTGIITINLESNKNELFLTVKDNGIGLPIDFEKTKHATMGMTLIQGLARQIGGTFNFKSVNGNTIFNLTCLF